MTQVAPLPMMMNAQNPDMGRPGQQLLPGYVVKLLKTLKIPFGTDRSVSGIDVDPSIALIGHIVDCLGALRDVNKVYRAKGSLASRSVGTRVMFGFTAELGNILLDAITFDPPSDLLDSSVYYSQVATSVLNVFPEIAAQVTPSTGKVLIHHTALKTSSTMAMESIKMVIKAFPAGAWTTDRTGALALHWITHNPNCTHEMINYLINANPKGPWVADMDGYLPLHWAVNQDSPNIDVVAALLSANASAAAKACLKGSLPLHWCVNRDRPNLAVLKALLQVHADGVRTFDKTGWLPLHQAVNRSDISLDALQLLVELYPQSLQCPNVNGQLPLHRALDQNVPSVDAVHVLLEAYPGAAKVADDEGYLPLHLALDCARPNPTIAKMLLDHFPESAFHKSKDGLLPIHCIISSVNPVIEIIQALLQIFPDSTESLAVDVIPIDESADPETWQGEWIEKRWTPLSRAIDRGLDAIVILFRDALHQSKSYSAAAGAGILPVRGASNATPKQLPPQQRPPMNALAGNGSPGLAPGPSTSSDNASRPYGSHTHSHLGGQGQLQGQGQGMGPMSVGGVDDDDFAPPGSVQGTYDTDGDDNRPVRVPQGQGQGQGQGGSPRAGVPGVHHGAPPGYRGPPSSAPPPRPSTSGASGATPVRSQDKYAEAKSRERERHRERERDRDRDYEHRHRSSSRRDRDRDRDRDRADRGERGDRDREHRPRDGSRPRGRYDDDEDRQRDRERRHRDRDSRRSSSRNHRDSRGDRGDRGGDRGDRGGDRGRERRDSRDGRQYEGGDDTDGYVDDLEATGAGTGDEQDDGYGTSAAPSTLKMRLMSGNRPSGQPPTPSQQPPKSLLEAASSRPFTRRGISNADSHDSHDRYNRDDDGYGGSTALDVKNVRGNGGNGALPMSLDDIV